MHTHEYASNINSLATGSHNGVGRSLKATCPTHCICALVRMTRAAEVDLCICADPRVCAPRGGVCRR